MALSAKPMAVPVPPPMRQFSSVWFSGDHGDVFHGAYALALAEGAAAAQAARFAVAAATLKCTRPGGRKGVASRAEVEAVVRQAG